MSLDARSPYPQDLRHGGVAASARAFVDRVRTGDLGALPVVTGLVLIGAVFQVLNPNFLSSANLVNLTMQSAAIGTMSIGIVLVLLVGGIDLSVGSVSGLAGLVTTKDGRLLAFAILADNVPVGGTLPAQDALDRIAVALANCGC